MRQRSLPKRTKVRSDVVAGNEDREYLVGAASSRGHSLSSQTSGPGPAPSAWRCARCTRTAAKREACRPREPLRQVTRRCRSVAATAESGSGVAAATGAVWTVGCADGLLNRTVAARLHTSGNTVGKWRERFRVQRLPGLADEPRPGAPRKATDDRIVDVITRTLEGPPAPVTQWTTRRMADVAGLSKATIARIWQTFGLQSHRIDTFKLSADPQFVEKVRDREKLGPALEELVARRYIATWDGQKTATGGAFKIVVTHDPRFRAVLRAGHARRRDTRHAF